jgi:hypothetical protein
VFRILARILIEGMIQFKDIGEWNVAGSRKASNFQHISNKSSNSFATLRYNKAISYFKEGSSQLREL